jgi:signal transduction histidine kinase
MLEELRLRQIEMERFTATVSHDLKSPLVTIKTFLGYLEQDIRAQKTEQIDKDLAYIHGAADKMSRLLEEALDLARAGHKQNPPVTAPLQEIVREALDLVAGQIAQRNVQVEVTREPIWLYGDRPRLVEVFENLVDNAVKFLGDQASPRVEIGMEPGDGGPVLFVRDNGKGIDPRHQSKLFGLFEKLDASQPGSGMGLAMVRRIVEIHGGKIWLQSNGLGHGTTVRFTLAKTELRQEAP